MKKVTGLIVTFIITLGIYIQDVSAQDFNRWRLPKGATARYGKGWVRAIEFSPLGDQLAVATTIGVWIYDVHTGREIVLFSGIMGDAYAVAFSPGGTMLAAAHADQTVRIWDIQNLNPRPINTFRGHTDRIYAVAFSPDGTMLASGSKDKNIRIWDPHMLAVDKQLIDILPNHEHIITLDFSLDSRMIAGGCVDGSIQIWDTGTGNIINKFIEHTDSVKEIDFSPDGTTLISASLDGNVILWTLIAPGGKISEPKQHNTAVYSVDFSQDGNLYATGGDDTNIMIWMTGTGVLKSTLLGHTDVIPTVKLSPNGKDIASGVWMELSVFGMHDFLMNVILFPVITVVLKH